MFVVSRVLRRSRRLPLRSCQAACGKFKTAVESQRQNLETPAVVYERYQSFPRYYQSVFVGRRMLCSEANAKSTNVEEDNIEDGFSELEAVNSAQQTSSDSDSEDDLTSEDDNEETPDQLALSDDESDPVKTPHGRKTVPGLLKAVNAPGVSVSSALDKWFEHKESSRGDIMATLLILRRRKLFGKALQMSEWLEANKKLEFEEREYASRLDLIAKVRGIQKAEAYIQKVPKSFRGEVMYRTLLANCVGATNVKKSEEVFNKMKDLEFPITIFSCNQLLLLYKRVDRKKIADVLLLMEKENVKPNAFSYKLLIDAKGQSNDITGMDQIVETMKAEGIEPELRTMAVIARHYASAGLKEKAVEVLREMEGERSTVNRGIYRSLILVYGKLGKADEVDRIWNLCSENPKVEECLAVIEAYGRVNNIEKAEAVFEKVLRSWKNVASHIYTVLLKVYVEHKMLSKGKDLIKRMGENGCKIGPMTWDALVRLYVQAGNVEKADSILNKAVQQNQTNLTPMMDSFMVIMEEYAKRGDIHNTEKMFHRMRLSGYSSRLKQFHALVLAYANAKTPAYGMRDRMKADNIFPNRPMTGLLARVDPFKKTAVSDLLD